MLTALIDLSLKNRFLVIALFALMAIGGVYSATQIPIDAVPDMTPDELEQAREYVIRGVGTVPVRKRAHDA